MDDLAVPGGEANVHKRIALAASMGSTLRPDESTYIAYEEITEIICHNLKIIGWLDSWPKHVRSCVERYELIQFHSLDFCMLFYWNYKSFYNAVQKLAEKETSVRII